MRQVWISAICALFGLIAMATFLFGNSEPLWWVEVVSFGTGGNIMAALVDYRDELRKRLDVLRDIR